MPTQFYFSHPMEKKTPRRTEEEFPPFINPSNYDPYDYVYCYKNFMLMNKVNFSLDLLNKVAVNTIFDVQKENTLCGLSLAHIWRKKNAESEFGKGFNLNLCERLKLEYDKMYYFDSFGDKYLLYNGVVKDMAYTRKVPEPVSRLKEYQDIFNMPITAERTRMLPTQWLVNGALTRGFNADGYLVMINDTYEKLLQIKFNENYKITEVKDIVGGYEANKYSFTYSLDGYLSSIKDDVQNSSVEYSYSNGYLATVKFSENNIFSITYKDSELTQIESSEGYICKFDYSAAWTVSVQSSLSEIPNGQSSTTLPAIFSRKIIFDNQKILIEHEDSQKELYEISEKGYLLAYYKQEDGVVNFAEQYDYVPREKSNTYKAKRDLLYKTPYYSFEFDYSEYIETTLNKYEQPIKTEIKNRPLSTGTTSDSITNYTYDDNGQCIKEQTLVTLKLSSGEETYNKIVEHSYNDKGKPVKKETYIEEEVEQSGKIVEEFNYDNYGYLTKVITYNSLEPAKKFYSEKTYNVLGQLSTVKDETGEYSTKYNYSGTTRKLSTVQYPNDNFMKYDYDAQGKISSIAAEISVNTAIKNEFAYSNGEVIELKGDSEELNLKYDNERRLKNITMDAADFQNISYITRNSLGLTPDITTTVTNVKGEQFTTQEKRTGEYIKYFYNGDLQCAFNFNKDGSIASKNDAVIGSSSVYSHDELGRLTEVEEQDKYVGDSLESTEYSEKYSYNEYGNLSEEIDSGTVIRNIKYTYENNALRRLQQMNVKIGTLFDFSVLPSYDVQGRYEGKSIAVNNTTIIGESIGYYFKNERTAMLPTSVFYSSNSVDILGRLKYEYDSSGNISHIENTTNNKNIYYTYDKLNRLIREDNEEYNYSWYYNYDNSGNILSKEILPYTTTDFMHGMASKIVYGYTNGKLTQYGKNGMSYDKLGNPTIYHGYRAIWGKGNQLTSYYNSDYAYDGFGRRIKKNNTVYLYDSCNRLIKSSDGMEYFYDHTGVMGFKYNKKLYFYQKDIQNNVIAIINDSGKLEYRYVYDAWGGHIVYDANGNQVATSTKKGLRPPTPTEIYDLNPFRYRSYFFDYETGLYYLKSRYYDPVTGRFMNMDGVQNSVPTVINGMNLFAYCINNPIMYVDNLGTTWEKIIDKRTKFRKDDKGTFDEHIHVEYDGKEYSWYKTRGHGTRHNWLKGYDEVSKTMKKTLIKGGVNKEYFSFSYVSLPRWVEGYELSYSQPFQEILVFEQPSWAPEQMQSDSVDPWQESFETKPVKPFRESFQIPPEVVTGVLIAAAAIIFMGLVFLTGGAALIFI